MKISEGTRAERGKRGMSLAGVPATFNNDDSERLIFDGAVWRNDHGQ